MISSETRFYIAGGTLRPDTPSYVERRADTDLYEGLQQGQFCYVLTSRQMGKSSLMVRTAARLREDRTAVAVLDLTRIGQNLTVEQWYEGLLDHLGRHLDLEDELEAFWEEHEGLGPLQRWMTALRDIVLRERTSRVVIFVDEIDAVRSLPFSADEFFAAIRECYTRRAEDAEYNRLTFCLLGVASPSDLIQDTRTTPFNIGRRIELADFSEAEAAPLAKGLGTDERIGAALLQRVLYWTGGHPYLTQRLCETVADDASVASVPGVDRQCEELFLSTRARERDDNLLFVRDRLLHSEADQASLLDLYGKVQAGKPVPPDDTNALIDLLRLSGIARFTGNQLVVRNRIYARVFDRGWVTEHMPDAELRRQRAAYRKGLLRTAAFAGVILVVLGVMAFAAVRSERRANRLAALRQVALLDARRAAQSSRRLLYASQMNLALQALDEGNLRRARELVEAQQPHAGEEDLRGFEWRYLWRRCRGNELYTWHAHARGHAVAFSPDGKILATAGYDPTVRLWDTATKRHLADLRQGTPTTSLAFTPDGKILAAGCEDDTVKLWNTASRLQVAELPQADGDQVWRLAISPDGKLLAAGMLQTNSTHLWNLITKQMIATFEGEGGAFSADSRRLALIAHDKPVTIWDLATKQRAAILQGADWPMAYSPDGKTLATGGSGGDHGKVKLWNLTTRRQIATLPGHKGIIASMEFSHDGKKLVTGSTDDYKVRLWDMASNREIATFQGHTDRVQYVRFSPNDRTIASAGYDGDVKLWDATARQEPEMLPARGRFMQLAPDGRSLVVQRDQGPVALCDLTNRDRVHVLGGTQAPVAFSHDGKTLATAGNRTGVTLWDVESRRKLASIGGQRGPVRFLVFSPDGKTLAIGGSTIRLWDVKSGRQVGDLRGLARAVVFSPDGRMLASILPSGWALAGGWPQGGPRVLTGAAARPPAGGAIARKVQGAGPGAVWLWSVADGRLRGVLVGFQYPQLTLAFAPDGKMLATGHWPNTTMLWQIPSGQYAATLNSHSVDGSVKLAFSPDGRTLATGSWDDNVTLWDVALHKRLATLKGHRGWINCLAFSPDGKTIASGSSDGIKLWSVATRQEVAALKGHAGDVGDLLFSSDGNTLISRGDDGVRLWRAATFAETDAASVSAPRRVSPE